MNPRLLFSIIIAILSMALAVCAVISFCSRKEIGASVGRLLLSILPPMIGNFLIISSTSIVPAEIGCYMYYIGIDFTAYGLLHYTIQYTHFSWPRRQIRVFVLILFGIDVIQLLANIVFGHAFTVEPVSLYGDTYYRMIPFLPQNLHRALVYATLATVLVILFVRTIHSSRIHARRYGTILVTLLIIIIWCTFYVVSGTPLDRSMIGYGVFGLLVFYFSLYYKPVRLMDRILVNISSELPDALFFFDDVGDCIWLNKEGRSLIGLKGTDLEDVPGMLQPFLEAIPEEGAEDWSSELILETKKGKRYYALKRQQIMDKRGYIDGSFLSIHDNTEDQMNLIREAYNARHDALTGMYNKDYLMERVGEVIAASEDGTQFSVVFLNIRNFKLINETFGNDFGDEVLKHVAKHLRKMLPVDAPCGRLSGDRFGFIVKTGSFDMNRIEEMLAGFHVNQGNVEYQVLLHMGVYRITDPSIEVSVMFDRARIAAASLENDYSTHFAWYNDDMRKKMLWEQELSNELADALESGQVVPYLQPMVDTEQRIVGAEALVRWNHPYHGFLSPAIFVPVFERNGMISEIDRYMWRKSCELLAEWNDNDMFISVNISPKDFYFLDVAGELRAMVREYGIDPSRLRLEITESLMITDVENKVKILQGLQEDGFIIEMDDFGSGYSSLNTLKDMPIDVIKIDMAFLRNASGDEKSSKILKNIIRMSTDLEILPLSEGVETEKQYVSLRNMGCKLFQGYHFARPMPVEQFRETYVKGA